jgi:AraC-like DNA-binding protein
MNSRAQSVIDDSSRERFISSPRLVPQTAGLMTRLAYDYAQKAGMPARAFARRIGITPRAVQDANRRLNANEQVAFLDSVAAAADDDAFGFHLAQHADIRAVGMFYYVLASSSQLIDVLQRIARYTKLVNEGVSQRCIDRRAVGLELYGASPSRGMNRHEVQFWMTTLLRLLRQLTGKRLAPERVCFGHARGRSAMELARFFGCDIEYQAPRDSILFASRVRHLRIVNADPYLNRLLIDICEDAMRKQSKRTSTFESLVENAIATLLPHGEADMSAVARRLAMSERTLARKLAAAGIGFSTLRTRLRQGLADRYLKEPDLSISEISWLLGFRDVSAFSHAYKRWTGRAPRQTRGVRRSVSHAHAIRAV